LLDLTGDAILVRVAGDRILYWNRAAENMYGFTSEEAVGKVSHDLLRTEFPEPLAARHLGTGAESARASCGRYPNPRLIDKVIPLK
jgi:PAS domain S-box-containing protein